MPRRPTPPVDTKPPRHTQPAKLRPLPSVDDGSAVSRFDEILSANPSIQALIEKQMAEDGVKAGTSLREYFILVMWKWTLTGLPKQQELAVRVLGRGYIGEKAPTDVAEKLFIEDYEEGVKSMLGKESTAGKKMPRDDRDDDSDDGE
jgi:hypothetical protein